MAGVFLLECNFTDARLLGLNSLRFSRLRIDRGWAIPYSPFLMRPCDGTSGLVRKNRRKAVFTFKRLLSQRNLSLFRYWVLGVAAFSGSAGKIGYRRVQPVFWQQNRRSRKFKTGTLLVDPGFSRTSGNVCLKHATSSGTSGRNSFLA